MSPMSGASAGGFLSTSATWEIPMEYYSAIKKMDSASCSEMDGPRDGHTK